MVSILWLTVYWKWFFGGAVIALLHDNCSTLLQAYRERREEQAWTDEYKIIEPTQGQESIDLFLKDIKEKLIK